MAGKIRVFRTGGGGGGLGIYGLEPGSWRNGESAPRDPTYEKTRGFDNPKIRARKKKHNRSRNVRPGLRGEKTAGWTCPSPPPTNSMQFFKEAHFGGIAYEVSTR